MADQLVDLNDDVLVADAVRRLVERFAPLRIILFGSRARGTAERDSDIDLLVVLPELHDKYMATVEMLRELRGLGIPVDVVPTDPEEVKRRGHVVGSVLREAIRHGKVVYERAGG
ncbi:MAG: nucleotidyltransferase domain-containing protein [Bacillota bacterium]